MTTLLVLKLVLSALVFVAFVPGVLVTLPPRGDRWSVLAVHGVLFSLLNHSLTHVLYKFVKV